MPTFTLRSTFRDATISKHRSLVAAVKAQRRYNKSFSGGSYDPNEIVVDGKRLSDTQHEEAMQLGRELGYW